MVGWQLAQDCWHWSHHLWCSAAGPLLPTALLQQYHTSSDVLLLDHCFQQHCCSSTIRRLMFCCWTTASNSTAAAVPYVVWCFAAGPLLPTALLQQYRTSFDEICRGNCLVVCTLSMRIHDNHFVVDVTDWCWTYRNVVVLLRHQSTMYLVFLWAYVVARSWWSQSWWCSAVDISGSQHRSDVDGKTVGRHCSIRSIVDRKTVASNCTSVTD